MNLWSYSPLETWAWRPHEELTDRSASPRDDPNRRPSHADRRKALQRYILRNEFLQYQVCGRHRQESANRRFPISPVGPRSLISGFVRKCSYQIHLVHMDGRRACVFWPGRNFCPKD
ncbi:MAG: hypothetical protein KatS3mg110_1986 [Pirellulaceae bacterium]|nr:MAG: hypothetical protein KatS3mg110_1986 [Pirellulaceae bacterium]